MEAVRRSAEADTRGTVHVQRGGIRSQYFLKIEGPESLGQMILLMLREKARGKIQSAYRSSLSSVYGGGMS